MRALGQRLAALLRPGDLVVLTGPLGAGKTTLVQGIGQGLGVRGPVTSPTFVIARVHPALDGTGPALVHADAYRLGSRAEVDDLDLDADLGTLGDRGRVGRGPRRGPGRQLPGDNDHDGAAGRRAGDGESGPEVPDEPRAVRLAAAAGAGKQRPNPRVWP